MTEVFVLFRLSVVSEPVFTDAQLINGITNGTYASMSVGVQGAARNMELLSMLRIVPSWCDNLATVLYMSRHVSSKPPPSVIVYLRLCLLP